VRGSQGDPTSRDLLRSVVLKKNRHMTRKRIVPWSSSESAADVAAVVRYVGSAEHKSHPSPAGPPKLRHNDASACDPKYVNRDADPITFTQSPSRALREAIASGRTSELVGRFPNYVWGLLDGVLYEARLVNQEAGWYKAYALAEDAELPDDPQRLLEGQVPWQS
jgi:hypothetical protein